jgi:hypothetical protein
VEIFKITPPKTQWLCEQPQSSVMQDLLVFLQMAARKAVYTVSTSMGAFGGPTQKNHRFYSNHSKVSVSS